MESESEVEIYSRLAGLEKEVVILRDGYLVINKRYTQALLSMKSLTSATLEAALRAAVAAEKSALACKNAATAATVAADARIIDAARLAVIAANVVQSLRKLCAWRGTVTCSRCGFARQYQEYHFAGQQRVHKTYRLQRR
jgi:hypothetical protein